jgi:hypothetical protein
MDQSNTQEPENMPGPGSPCSAWLGRVARAEESEDRLAWYVTVRLALLLGWAAGALAAHQLSARAALVGLACMTVLSAGATWRDLSRAP